MTEELRRAAETAHIVVKQKAEIERMREVLGAALRMLELQENWHDPKDRALVDAWKKEGEPACTN